MNDTYDSSSTTCILQEDIIRENDLKIVFFFYAGRREVFSSLPKQENLNNIN